VSRSCLGLAVALVGLADAAAAGPPRLFERWWRQAELRAATPAGCEDGAQPSGALYRICLPTFVAWNGELVVYAHGYTSPTSPISLPEEAELLAPAFTLPGRAFAVTSFRANGLVVLDAIEDLRELVEVFTAAHGPPSRVLVVGASQGGLIAALALERHPETFAGGLAMCGPYGGFASQVDHVGDFRVVFDAMFPGALPPTAVDIPADLMADWDARFEGVVRPAIADPANTARVDALLAVTGAASDAGDPSSRENTVSGLLWYNVFGTADAAARLGGQPYENRDHVYSGSSLDAEINAAAARFAADAPARAAIADGYETSGRLERPLVTLHTTGDEIVPYWHAERYREKIEAQGSAPLHVPLAVERYGHCNFDPLEVLGAFDRLVDRVEAAR
jgi:pimeloyl-ACP methyl ester carboxylesterase